MSNNIELIVNNPIEKLSRLADNATEINITIAFLTEKGLEWLNENNYSKCKFIIGVDSGITTKSAIKMLDEKGSSVNIFHNPSMFFHPKSIWFKSTQSEHIFIGSHNLTGSALNSNYELSALIERNKSNLQFFSQFQIQFRFLLNSDFCNKPDNSFYENYNEQKFKPINPNVKFSKKPSKDRLSIPVKGASVIKEYLIHIANDFPNLKRKKAQIIREHPLKKINQQKYVPAITKLFQENINPAIKFRSDLNQGGNWRRIPNIFIDHESSDDWNDIRSYGHLAVQWYYSDDFRQICLAFVIQYELDTKDSVGAPPLYLENRIRQIKEMSNLTTEFPSIIRFQYKDIHVWSKPLMQFEYELDALPSDDIIFNSIKELLIIYLASLNVK